MAEGPCHLAQKHRAAVTQLWVPMAKLMARIGLRDGVGTHWHLIAGNELWPILPKGNSQLIRQCGVEN